MNFILAHKHDPACLLLATKTGRAALMLWQRVADDRLNAFARRSYAGTRTPCRITGVREIHHYLVGCLRRPSPPIILRVAQAGREAGTTQIVADSDSPASDFDPEYRHPDFSLDLGLNRHYAAILRRGRNQAVSACIREYARD